MAVTKDGASLAHIADTVTAVAGQMTEHGEVQRNILAVLNDLLETSRAQSEMLADILGARDVHLAIAADAHAVGTDEIHAVEAARPPLLFGKLGEAEREAHPQGARGVAPAMLLSPGAGMNGR